MADSRLAISARLRTQAARTDDAISDLRALVDSAEDGLLRLRATPGDIFTLMGAGGLLHGFYSTFEGLMRDVGEALNGSSPSGPDWHARLLDQLGRDVPRVRPALYPAEARASLDALRGFRHLFRNLYVFNLRAEPIETLLAELPTLWAVLEPALRSFAASLRRVADGIDGGSPGESEE